MTARVELQSDTYGRADAAGARLWVFARATGIKTLCFIDGINSGRGVSLKTPGGNTAHSIPYTYLTYMYMYG